MMLKKHFQPGELVPETAVYAVIHDGHRSIHHAILRKDELFPQRVEIYSRAGRNQQPLADYF